MTISLKYRKDKESERLYVRGTQAETVWLEKGATGIRVSNCGINGHRIIGMIEGAYGVLDPSWEDLVALAKRTAEAPSLAQAAHEIDLAKMGAPLPEPTTLLVDRSEPHHIVTLLRQVKNLIVEITDLAVGRYALPGLMTIERRDAVSLGRQLNGPGVPSTLRKLGQIANESPFRVIIVEGDLMTRAYIDLKAMSGAMTYLATVRALGFIPSVSQEHTAYIIAKLVRHRIYGTGRPERPAETRNRALDHARYVLEGLPGVNSPKAINLLQALGSLRAVMAADAAVLATVPGIDEALAQHIACVIAARPFADKHTSDGAQSPSEGRAICDKQEARGDRHVAG